MNAKLADTIAIPFFAFLIWDRLDRGIENWRDYVILGFGVGGLLVDSYLIMKRD